MKFLSLRTLIIIVFGTFVLASSSQAVPIFSSATISSSFSFTEVLGSSEVSIAFDGTNYWTAIGGSAGGTRLAKYDASGSNLGTYAPGLDFRSLTADGAGDVYARAYNNTSIFIQSSDGVFTTTGVSVGGVSSQPKVILNGDGTEYIAHDTNGTVRRWDLSGNALSSVSLSGYGANSGESGYYQDSAISAAGDYWLTYSEGILSAWDDLGNRVDQTTLLGAGSNFNSHLSQSYANGMFFVMDNDESTWRGYELNLDLVSVPEPSSLLILSLGLLALGLRREKVRLKKSRA
ncbi:MAG: hypothetical protein COA96_02200 [SAR86 cluster bacterium]|uniref:Ice-binding protein C-terminal domain-containing protein n=1 Tax=SAR86 cluster bacterium TaxID=2030880 RepID=A0A2A5B961_9GAMM|nr:MAG: hypothetical protein COA96_02200 [SAR86 cluster bacterium]